ncbi:hypothetical protein GQ457_04G030350 [Hibiscus cannabinus]
MPSKYKKQLLAQILKKNVGIEYLSRYLNGKTDKELFKMNVSVVSYEDTKPYIDRIVDARWGQIQHPFE